MCVVFAQFLAKPHGCWLGGRWFTLRATRNRAAIAPQAPRNFGGLAPRLRHRSRIHQRLERVHIDQAGDLRVRLIGAHFVGQLIDVLATRSFAMRHHVFELDQALQMHAQLRVAPRDGLAQRTPAEAHVDALEDVAHALGAHVLVGQLQEPACLRRQLIQAAAEHVVGNAVGQRDVGQRHLDVLDALPKSQQQFVSRMLETVLAQAAAR